MKMSVIEFDCIVGNGFIVLIAQLVCLIGCVHPFEKAFFHFSDSDFHTVWGENSLIGQVLLLRVGYSGKGISLIIHLAWPEDHMKVELRQDV